MKPQLDKIRAEAAFDDGRTLGGLLLEMKLAATVDERILAEELITNNYARLIPLIEKLCRVIEAQDAALTNLIYQIESDCMEDSAGKTGAGWTFINDIKKARETKAEARRILGGEDGI